MAGPSSLPPGFHFFPSDEELVVHFLRRKASLLPCQPDIVPTLLLNRYDPWELNGKALQAGNRWYFFSHATQSRTSPNGHWSPLGADETVSSGGCNVGLKKTLVFSIGEHFEGNKSNWVMHEYHLLDGSYNCSSSSSSGKRSHKKKANSNSNTESNSWVICRVFESSCDSQVSSREEGMELSCLDEVFLSLDDYDEVSFQDTCNAGRAQAADVSPSPSSRGVAAAAALQQAVSRSRTASSTSPSSDIVISPVGWPGAPAMPSPMAAAAAFHRFDRVPSPPSDHLGGRRNLELQLMPASGSSAGGAASSMMAYYAAPHSPPANSQGNDAAMQLQLSIGFCGGDSRGEFRDDVAEPRGEALAAARAKEDAREQLRLAMAEKAAADEARAQAKLQAELAEQELASAKRMRHQAQVELSRAHALREHAVRQVNATLLQITCLSCRHKFRAARPPSAMCSEVACSYVSSVVTEAGDAEVDNVHDPLNADGLRRRQHTRMDPI